MLVYIGDYPTTTTATTTITTTIDCTLFSFEFTIANSVFSHRIQQLSALSHAASHGLGAGRAERKVPLSRGPGFFSGINAVNPHFAFGTTSHRRECNRAVVLKRLKKLFLLDSGVALPVHVPAGVDFLGGESVSSAHNFCSP